LGDDNLQRMDTTTLVGLSAGFFTTIAFVPQVAKIWKTRSAKDVSLPAFIAFTFGLGLWLCYGILNQELPIIVWNAVTLMLAGAILAMKLKFG
jgi:MtN3 and saliva related transmembrane protein